MVSFSRCVSLCLSHAAVSPCVQLPASSADAKLAALDTLPLTLLGSYEGSGVCQRPEGAVHHRGSKRSQPMLPPVPRVAQPRVDLSISRAARLVRETYSGPSAKPDDFQLSASDRLKHFTGYWRRDLVVQGAGMMPGQWV